MTTNPHLPKGASRPSGVRRLETLRAPSAGELPTSLEPRIVRCLGRCVEVCAGAARAYADAAMSPHGAPWRSMLCGRALEREVLVADLRALVAAICARSANPDAAAQGVAGPSSDDVHRSNVKARSAGQQLLERCAREELCAHRVFDAASADLRRMRAPDAIRAMVDAQRRIVSTAQRELEQIVAAWR
jgi:hypothetical protein